MSFILKMATGLYIFSVLAFSSWSKAAEGFSTLRTSNISIGHLTPVASKGIVFEENGYLYFKADNKSAVLIHSNSFSFFEDSKLPENVYIEGQSLNSGPAFNNLNAMVQITSVEFLTR